MSRPPRPPPMNCRPRSTRSAGGLAKPPRWCGCGRRSQGHQSGYRRAGAGRAEDRRRHQTHSRHRRTDQPARAQRHHRSGARRRSGPRLRGGGLRSEIARGATAKATEDISSQILEVQNSTGKAVEAIGRIAQRMGEIDSYTSAVADLCSSRTPPPARFRKMSPARPTAQS